jgi:hypothetical protein
MIYLVKSGKLHLFKSVLILVLFSPVLIAQHPNDSGWVRFGPDYEFREGFYGNIDMVKANRPIPPARIVSELSHFDHGFYKKVLSTEEMSLYDDQGVRISLKTKDIWGYAYQGEIYVQVGERFHRLILEGNISRFLASSTTWEKSYGSPDGSKSGYTSTGHYFRRAPIYTNITREGEVYLLDMEENLMKGYYPEALMHLLERDSVLYHDYVNLGKSQRKKQMRQFIVRYNQRHPLYLPATSIN